MVQVLRARAAHSGFYALCLAVVLSVIFIASEDKSPANLPANERMYISSEHSLDYWGKVPACFDPAVPIDSEDLALYKSLRETDTEKSGRVRYQSAYTAPSRSPE